MSCFRVFRVFSVFSVFRVFRVFRGSVVPWFRGSVVPWFSGSVVQCVPCVPWFSGSVCSVVPWFPCARNAKNPRKNRMASPRHYLLKTTRRAVPLDADTYGSKTDFRECINDGFEFLAREKP
jgi:hypothetical protein